MVLKAAILVNLQDGSGLLNPTLEWSLSDESELVAGLFLPWGASPRDGVLRSEPGSTFEALWVQWRWSW